MTQRLSGTAAARDVYADADLNYKPGRAAALHLVFRTRPAAKYELMENKNGNRA